MLWILIVYTIFGEDDGDNNEYIILLKQYNHSNKNTQDNTAVSLYSAV